MNKEERIKEIDVKIAELRIIVKEKDKKWFENLIEKRENSNWDFIDEFNQYHKYLNPEQDEINKLSDEKRMIKPYTLSPIPKYGDVMSLKNFIEDCICGNFIDYDGSGYYVDNDDSMMTDISIYPSDIMEGRIRDGFDTIIWFNK